ncbi:MAG: SdrD B-like domain-containing protein [Caldilineaceae bacterium]
MLFSSFRQRAAYFLPMLLLLITALTSLTNPVFAQTPPSAFDATHQCFAVADERITDTGIDSQDTLIRVDRTTGETFVVGLTGTLNAENLAFGPSNVLYAVDGGQVGTLDPTTGVFTARPLPLGFARGAAGTVLLSDVDGIFYDIRTHHFYGSEHRYNKPSLLFMFDPSNGSVVTDAFGAGVDYLVISGVADVDDIAIDPQTDVMYIISETGALYTADKTTGVTTQVAPLRYPTPYPPYPTLAGQIVYDTEGLSFFNDGQMYSTTGANGPDPSDRNKLFRIDKATGIATMISSFPDGIQDIEGVACLSADAHISVKKFTNGPNQLPQDADTATGPLIPAGAEVTWSYVISNTGVLTLTNLTLLDDKVGLIGPDGQSNCPPPDAILLPGDSLQCSATGIAQAGQYTNTAQATGSTPPGVLTLQKTVTDTDVSHYFGTTPGIVIEKFTNGKAADDANDPDVPQIAPGAAVTWTYRITNTGTAAFNESQIKVTDNLVGPISQIISKGNNDHLLAPGESWTYRKVGAALNLLNNLSGITKVPGCDPGHTGLTRPTYENVGMVVAGTVAAADLSHYCNTPAPAIDIEKFTAGNQADNANDADVPQIAPGSLITWTYHVLNTGNVPFTAAEIKVTDSNFGVITQIIEKGNGDTILSPGEMWVYETSGTAVNLLAPPVGITTTPGCDPNHTGLTRPAYENIGAVTVQNVADLDKSHYCNVATPGLAIQKLTNNRPANGPNDPDVPVIAVGAPITWTYRITNTGNVPFAETALKVQDNILGAITQIVNKGNGDALLAPGETWVYQKTGTAANLSKTQAGLTIVPGCDFNHTGQTRPTYENIGTVTALTITVSNASHYCNPTASVGDRVFHDLDPKGATSEAINAGNGVQDAGESGLDGVQVQLRTAVGSLVATTTTANGGAYRFDNVAPGSYYLVFVNPALGVWAKANQGADDALDSDADPSLVAGVPGNAARTAVFALASGQVDLRWDAGIVLTTGSLGDYVWHDRNGNGVQDEGPDLGLANVTVKLFTNNDQLIATTTTDAKGFYRFSNVKTGQYYLAFDLPPSFDGFSPAEQGGDQAKDSNVTTQIGQSGHTPVFTFTANGLVDLAWDAGLYQAASVGDFVWLDDGDGLQQPTERTTRGVAGVTVELYQLGAGGIGGAETKLAKTTATDGNGFYKITGLPPGSYYLRFIPSLQEKYIFVHAHQGSDDSVDNDVVSATGATDAFSLVSAQYDDTHDAGLQAVTAEEPVAEPVRIQLFLPLVANQ